jgi:hypothetical protein
MKNRLKSLKQTIEREFGHIIHTPLRKREYTYARAVYCKIAREMSNGAITHSEIGKSINRDHATVMHSIKVVFPFAMREKFFKDLYDALSLIYQPEQVSPVEEFKSYQAEASMRDRVIKLVRQNKELKYKLESIEKGNELFEPLFRDLSYDELNEVHDKMKIMVKAIKSRVYV